MSDPDGKPTLVAFGDSITEAAGVAPPYRWTALLERRLADDGTPVRIVNSGIGGNTTDLGLARFDADVLSHRPDIVTIEFGLNDCNVAVDVAPRNSPDRFRQNQRRIGQLLQDQNGATLFYITNQPTLWDVIFADGHAFDRRSREYNEITRDVARELGATVIDVERVFNGADVDLSEALTEDGVHLTEYGNREYALAVGDALSRELSAT